MAQNLDRLKAILNLSGIQLTNNSLFQVVSQLIDATKELQQTTASIATSAPTSVSTLQNRTYLTELDETPNLPSARQEIAGAGIQIDDGTPGRRVIRTALPIPSDGLDGKDGEQGAQGIQGLQGPIGPMGPPGLVEIVEKESTLMLMQSVDSTSAEGNPVTQTTTLTGTQNNFVLAGRFTYLRCTGVTDVIFTGFNVLGRQPLAGDRVIIENLTAGTLRVSSSDVGSTLAYRLLCPSTRGQIVGFHGKIELVYDGVQSHWIIRNVFVGQTISPAFNAANFTAIAPFTWTVGILDVVTFAYKQNGRLLTIYLTLVNTTPGGTAGNALLIALPNSFSWLKTTGMYCRIDDNGTPVTGFLLGQSGNTFFSISKNDASNYALAADNTDVFGVLEGEVS